MDEYVRRADLLAEYDRQHVGPPGGARKIMETMPAADVQLVVWGTWVMSEDAPGYAVCSNCHDFYMNPEFMTNGKWSFCPNCGARMTK